MFGVCCDHPSVLGTEESHKIDGRPPPPPPPAMVMPPNWPPPLPTYPPSTTSQSPMKPPMIPPWPPQQQQQQQQHPHNFTTTTTTASYGNNEEEGFEYQCGLKNGPQDQERIVGGQNADPGEWPWIVRLTNKTNKSNNNVII